MSGESNFKRTADWLNKSLEGAGLEKDKKRASVQFGCIIEEMTELLASISIDAPHVDAERFIVCGQLAHIAGCLKRGYANIDKIDHVFCVDALADVKVTCDGFAEIVGYDMDGADKAVLDANDAKLVDGKPVIKPGGKIGKPDGWSAPDMAPFIKDLNF